MLHRDVQRASHDLARAVLSCYDRCCPVLLHVTIVIVTCSRSSGGGGGGDGRGGVACVANAYVLYAALVISRGAACFREHAAETRALSRCRMKMVASAGIVIGVVVAAVVVCGGVDDISMTVIGAVRSALVHMYDVAITEAETQAWCHHKQLPNGNLLSVAV